MWTALIGGIAIGLGTNWLGVFILPIFVGFFSCLELYFLRRKGSLRPRHITKMKESGMSEEEIAEIKETYQDIDTKTMDLGMSKIKLYGIQVLWTYCMTLGIALVTALIKHFLL
jgi:hypothetical protein